jgi:ribonuclease G
LAEWLYEEGIGENRAILVEDGKILEAAIELPGELRAGAIVAGRLTEILIPGRRGLVASKPDWFVLEPLPPHLTKGQVVNVEVVREPILEPGNHKYAKGRITDEAAREGPSLAERIGDATVLRATDADRFEQAGWSELLEDAISGEIFFSGGNLRMSLTPAMTLFDVDGALLPEELAEAGAAAAARAIRQLAIGGSIGIDLPTLPKDQRQAAAAAVDAILPQPFERTAVNGFGFLQIVRRRTRPSIPELLHADQAAASARALLRRAERLRGKVAIHAAPRVILNLKARPDWLAELARRTGGEVALFPNPGLAISGGHVQQANP